MAETVTATSPEYTAQQKRFISLLSTHARFVKLGRATEAQISTAANALIDATNLMLRDGTNALFDLMWLYHQDEKNGACNETRALKGFTSFSEQKSYGAALVYNAFRAVINNINWGSYNAALVKLPNGPKLINYLESKKTSR